jgi:hypothetical protein
MFLLENAADLSAEVSSVVSSVAGQPDVFEKSGLANLAQDASFGERLSYALKYAAVGMATVFMVLAIIMAVLYIFKLVSVIASKKKKTAASVTTNAVDTQASASADDSEEAVVAVATAAIAAARGESDCAFNVISITKIQ